MYINKSSHLLHNMNINPQFLQKKLRKLIKPIALTEYKKYKKDHKHL